jgi:hypothetical protein
MFGQIQYSFSVDKLTTDCQHASGEGHSTCTALKQMTDDWLKDIDNKRIVGVILLTINCCCKNVCVLAFQPLPYCGFRDIYLIELRGSSLMEARDNVKHVNCGVPQGCSLGPLLFYIFTNDLPLALNKACVSMYADDSTIYASATTAS